MTGLADHDLICTLCRYDLRAAPHDEGVFRCPECGGRSSLHQMSRRVDRRRRAVRDALLALGLIVSTLLLAIIWERIRGNVTGLEFGLVVGLMALAFATSHRWYRATYARRLAYTVGLGLGLILVEALRHDGFLVPLTGAGAIVFWIVAFESQARRAPRPT